MKHIKMNSKINLKRAACAALSLMLASMTACGTAASGSAAASSAAQQTASAFSSAESHSETEDTSSAAAASQAESESTASPAAVTFEDNLGETVTVQNPQRVAILIGSFADIWCLAGGKDTIVAAADDTWTGFDLGLSDSVVSTGGVKTPNAESILAADPDFIIASSHTSEDVDLKDTFAQAGIPTAYFDVNDFDDYLHMLKICTDITGHPEKYETFGIAVENEVNTARKKAQTALAGGAAAPRCLYVRATASGVTVKGSNGNVLGEMLADLGAVNIADSDTGLLDNLSMENIIADDPDFIFAVVQASTADKQADAEQALRDSLTSDPAWSSLSAVQNDRYYVLENRLYNLKPNARWGEAYEKLEKILYAQ